MISSMIRCGYCIFWQLLFKEYFEIVKDLISKYNAHIRKQCYFKCNRPHQPMNILWPKSIYCKFGKQTNPIYFHPYACIKHILAIVVWRWSIFSQNAIPTYQKYLLKFKRSQQPMPTQIWILHVWPKKPIPILSLNYYKSAPKIHYILYDPYVGYYNFGHIS
jgi:hypothetical protein